MAMDCFICRGDGRECHTCHGTGWIEILGAGMVHPEIIETAGYDSSRVTGFAFGIGVDLDVTPNCSLPTLIPSISRPARAPP